MKNQRPKASERKKSPARKVAAQDSRHEHRISKSPHSGPAPVTRTPDGTIEECSEEAAP